MAVAQDYQFPCDTCGSDLRFDPVSGDMLCDHCGNTEPVIENARSSTIRELDFSAAIANDLAQAEIVETRTTTCPNCAAEVSFDAETHATQCPFCATPVVADTGTNRHLKPKGLVPFALDEPSARKQMTDWLGALWFAPNGLKEYARKGRKMSGIYVPYWTYDADTYTVYRGERGEIYFETHTVVRDGKRVQRQVAKTRWYHASGQLSRQFDDILVLASKSLPPRYTRALAPWDLSDLAPYNPEYLAGFQAEGYTIDLDEGYYDAREQMDRRIERDIRFDIGGDKQRIHTANTDVREVTFKHILLPIWLAAYKYRGKTYRFVVNGQSGAVEGERPYSTIKIVFALILAAIVGAALMYGLYLNNEGQLG